MTQHNRLLSVPTCYGLTDLSFVADLLRGSRRLVMDLLRGNWCNGILVFSPPAYSLYLSGMASDLFNNIALQHLPRSSHNLS